MIRITLLATTALTILFVAFVFVVQLVDWKQYANTIAKVVMEQTGRHLEIGGPVRARLFPVRVLIDDVTYANAPGGSNDVMVRVKRVDARFKLTDLIRGKLSLSIDLGEPDVLLETLANGEKNWSISLEVPIELAFVQLKVTSGQVVFREHPYGEVWRLMVDQLSIRGRSVGGYTGRLEATLNDIPVEISGNVKPETNVTRKRDGISIDGQVDISDTKLKFEGLASKGAIGSLIEGKVQVNIPNLQAFEKLLRTSLPSPPPINLAANVAASSHRVSVEEVEVAAGNSSFTGNIAADIEGKRPKIKGTVSAKLIDISELNGSRNRAVEINKASGIKGRPATVQLTDIPSFDKADINLTISIEKLLAARNLIVQKLQTNVVFAGGRLAFKPLKMSVAGTDFNLEGTAEGLGGRNVNLSAKLNAAGIDLGELLKTISGKEELIGGRTEVVADLKALGPSPAKLASTVTCHVRVSVGPGRLNNRNLDKL